jgi:hypothetical protein
MRAHVLRARELNVENLTNAAWPQSHSGARPRRRFGAHVANRFVTADLFVRPRPMG